MQKSDLFLPFTPNGQITELRAIEVKKHLGIGARAFVDPFAVLPDVPAELIDFVQIKNHPALQAMIAHAQDWSGLVFSVPDVNGDRFVLLNPTDSSERQRATLMEEIVHMVLDHPMSLISVHDLKAQTSNLASSRTHVSDVEDEAFCVGAACLIPYPILFNAVRAGETVFTIAARFKVSAELVRYRIKRAGLTNLYKKHHKRL